MRLCLSIFLFIFSIVIQGQGNIPKALKELNKESVPYILVNKLQRKKNIIFLDAREVNEYQVSHIKGAIQVGFDHFNAKTIIKKIRNKKRNIVVYCSIGVRSERIGEKLQKLGYRNVYNLFGGIFEYKNSGGKLVNSKNIETDSVHTYNKEWSTYLNKGIKIYEN